MTNEEIDVRVARLEERMSDLEDRFNRLSLLIQGIDNRQWYILLALVGNIAGMAGTFIAVLFRT